MQKFMQKNWKELLLLWYLLTTLSATLLVVVVHATSVDLYSPTAYIQGLVSILVAFVFSSISLLRAYSDSKPANSLLFLAGVIISVLGLLITLTKSGGWDVTLFAAASIGLSLHVAAEQTRWGRRTEMIVYEMIAINVSIIMASVCLLVFPTIIEEYATRTYTFFVIAAITCFPVLSLSFDIAKAVTPSPKNLALGCLSSVIAYCLALELSRPIGEQSMVVLGMMLGVAIMPFYVTILLIGKKLG